MAPAVPLPLVSSQMTSPRLWQLGVPAATPVTADELVAATSTVAVAAAPSSASADARTGLVEDEVSWNKGDSLLSRGGPSGIISLGSDEHDRLLNECGDARPYAQPATSISSRWALHRSSILPKRQIASAIAQVVVATVLELAEDLDDPRTRSSNGPAKTRTRRSAAACPRPSTSAWCYRSPRCGRLERVTHPQGVRGHTDDDRETLRFRSAANSAATSSVRSTQCSALGSGGHAGLA